MSFPILLILAVCMTSVGTRLSDAQAAKAHPRAPAPTKKHCQPAEGFCFSYPASWVMLGEAFGDGVVVAPQQSIDRTLWDEITVATIVPAPADGDTAMTIDQVIDTAMNNMRDRGDGPQTLQRQVRTVDGLPAQMVKLRYHDQETNRDWIEELVFVEGPAGEIYSVALKASPASIGRIEPSFAGILRSWTLQRPEADSDGQQVGASPSH